MTRVASAMLLSLSFLATALEVKAQPNTELSTLGQSSTNAPIPPKMPAVSLVGSFNSAAATPPAPSPAPPIAPSMSDLVDDANIGTKAEGRSALFESIRNFGKGVLRKVKKEPKPKVVSRDADFMSELHDTVVRKKSIKSGDKKNTKPKKVVKQAPKLTEQDIARKKAENLARSATIREQNKKQWEEAARKMTRQQEKDAELKLRQ